MAAASEADSNASSLYRAVWRWHFYAGLLVLPFLVLLAVTGALYLFKPELDHALYRHLIETSARDSTPAPARVAMTNVERAMSGRVLQITLPVVLPFVGASLLGALVIDWLATRWRRLLEMRKLRSPA